MFRFSFVPIQNCVLGSLERLFTRCDHVWNIFKTKGMGKGLSKLAHLNRDLNQVWESSKPLPLSLYPGGPRNDCGRQRWSARPQGCHHHHCIAFITITITIIVISMRRRIECGAGRHKPRTLPGCVGGNTVQYHIHHTNHIQYHMITL